ncbi:unnamed protein product [Clavelina lepadiformis]|uniref:Uncharacterized protein n=1 Tax=Clavelina lepadiformis TaxID=159417 RepID=A0ABP0GUM0_CLALP
MMHFETQSQIMATKYFKIDKHRKMTNNQLNPSFGIHLIKISKTVLKSFEENLATSCLKSKVTQLRIQLRQSTRWQHC